jgi:hypothetical protein
MVQVAEPHKACGIPSSRPLQEPDPGSPAVFRRREIPRDEYVKLLDDAIASDAEFRA